jgi:branched-chain amino acid transport system ATP-binding protein
MALLSASGISLAFAGVRALAQIDLQIEEGELLGIIGPNGSGKSTLFNVLSGIYRVDEGSIVFRGQHIERLGVAQIVRCGIARTFQNKRLFGTMSVLENVVVAAMKGAQGSALGDVLGLRSAAQARDKAAAIADRCLALTGLAQSRELLARDLPYGAQNRLELARALALEPTLLLLDEPAAGLNPSERAELRELIRRIHGEGLTIALVEHDVRMVTGLCARAIVLDHGEKIADGASTAVVRDPRVQAAYFGVVEGEEEAHGV